MTTIYQLMMDDKQICDVYYNETDAEDNAEQVAVDNMKAVEIWGAEEIKDIPYDQLDWSLISIIWV